MAQPESEDSPSSSTSGKNPETEEPNGSGAARKDGGSKKASDPSARGGQSREVVIAPIRLSLRNLPRNSLTTISISPEDPAVWYEGHNINDGPGIQIAPAQDASGLFLQRFSITANQICLVTMTLRDGIGLDLELFVRSPGSNVRGWINLPYNSMLTITTAADRQSLVNESSFWVLLK